MTQAHVMPTDAQSMAETYERDGFIAPIDIVDPDAAHALRLDLEKAEAELAGDPEKLALLYSYPDRVLPSFDRLIRHDALISAASAALGPDLMVWSAALFIKEARSPKIVSWHQDLTYWGLDDAEETTLWFALSPATVESGCMKFVPGSHHEQIVPHVDTFADDNLLSRGQEIAVDVNEDEAVAAELQPGQASMHHGHLFHSSGPNATDDRRIGAAIRYIKPSMKQQSGGRPLVALVSGDDEFGHFEIAGAPEGRLTEEDFTLCRRDAKLKKALLFEGVDVAP
ncbi:phytanoyl-CoA dioxygenase family protein [uncultured Roseobacter sp.]|uniref:phytanoyl-CoA dioxygenase family protein n=1 Tax=uncultured Roseobacter sp. TaxID=114847 RepID=UPI0026246543|nr:phytanoyl-CoA dioxygenase family protein [uncultured Roseobacter sp.]